MKKEDKEFLKNNSNTPTYSQIQSMLKAGKISKTHALELIKTREKTDKLQADLEYKKTRNKEIALGVVDIATAAIPIGGGAKVASKLAGKLAPKLGKKIAKSVAQSTIDGAKTGAVHGALTGAIDEDKNPVTQAIKETFTGEVFGASAAYGAGKVWQKAEGAALKKIEDLKALRKAEKKYYKDYIIGRTIEHEKLGKIDFTKAGLETVSWYPEAGRHFDRLMDDIKNAKYLDPEPLKHPRKDKAKQFHILENDIQQLKIHEESAGNKKYYISKLKSGTNDQPTRAGSVPLNKLKGGLEDRPLQAGTVPPSNLKGDPEDRLNRTGAVSPDNSITKFFERNNPMRNEIFQKGVENSLMKSAIVESPKLFDEKENQEYWQTNSSQNSLNSPSKFLDFNGIRYKGVPWNNWSSEGQRAFLEGLFGKPLESINKKGNWTDKFNMGNPHTDRGHWVTLDNGKHIFIKD